MSDVTEDPTTEPDLPEEPSVVWPVAEPELDYNPWYKMGPPEEAEEPEAELDLSYAPFQDPEDEGDGEEDDQTEVGPATPPLTTSYDPAGHTVAEVQTYIAEHPDEAEAILILEAAGKNRSTLVGSA